MFSIVIPTKNEEDNIEKLLQSIVSQDIQPDKIVIADDSTDDTRKVASKYDVEFVQGVSDGRIGVARNRGAAEVDSKYILFLDADIVLPPGFFRKLVYTFIADGVDIATCYLGIDNKKLKNVLYFESWNAIKKFGSLTKFITTESGACMIIKKEVFDRVGGFSTEIKVGEDSNIIKKILKSGGKYKIIPVKIITSSRRLDRGPIKLLLFIFGLAGLFVVSKVGGKTITKKRGFFEKMYGEMGGKGRKKQK